MLPYEIEPFANAHIENLQFARELLEDILTASNIPNSIITKERVMDTINNLKSAQRGFERFKVCMADEVKQKDRYRKFCMENGYPYS